MALENWVLKSWNKLHDKGAYFPLYQEYKAFERMPDWFIDHVTPKPTEQALEIGCGFGAWMVPMSRLVHSVAGIDIHPDPLSRALNQFVKHQRYNCYVALSPGDSIPFPNDKFDLVYSITVFQHLPKSLTRTYITEAFRVLKPGGRCAFQFLDFEADPSIIRPKLDITPETHLGDRGDPQSCGWTKNEILTAAQNAGFINIALHPVNQVWFLLVGSKRMV